MNKRKKILLGILIILVIFALIIFLNKYRKYKILMKIGEVGINLRESKNFYYEVKDNDDSTNDLKIWVKNDKFAINLNKNNISYTDIIENKTYHVNESNKTYTISNAIPEYIQYSKSFSNAPVILVLAMNKKTENTRNEEFDDMFNNIYELKKDTYNGKECYKISYENDDINETTWFDVESYLPIKTEYDIKDSNMNIKREYIILTKVNDENVIFKEIDNYELISE